MNEIVTAIPKYLNFATFSKKAIFRL